LQGPSCPQRIEGVVVTAVRQSVDPDAASKGPGEEWRAGLPPEHEEMVQAWEKHPAAVGTGKTRANFRKVINTAPEVDGPVYRGDTPKNTYGFKSRIEASHPVGKQISFGRYSSTSTRPEVAGGFGHVLYEIHGHGARGIGNTLHEAVMPPGKFIVHSTEWRHSPTRAVVDGRTMSNSEHLHVVLHPAKDKTASMQASDFEGDVGNPNHITRNESGHLSIDAVTHMRGARGEMPGEHRNRQGQNWEDFKADIAANGIRNPIFITVDHGKEPVISEGSHRRDAAVELGHTHIPAMIRYYGHAEHEGTVEQRSRRTAARFTPSKRVFTHTDGLDHRLFDGEHLRPEVRLDVIQKFTLFCLAHDYREFSSWAKLVFFGSEASEWTSLDLEGNGDFDLSLGVDFSVFRNANPRYGQITDTAIAQMLTDQMHRELNDPQHYFEVNL
jgi:hypothetical protein